MRQDIEFNFDAITTRTGKVVTERRGTVWMALPGARVKGERVKGERARSSPSAAAPSGWLSVRVKSEWLKG
eukprot:464721-Rhodomonas_salina.1